MVLEFSNTIESFEGALINMKIRTIDISINLILLFCFFAVISCTESDTMAEEQYSQHRRILIVTDTIGVEYGVDEEIFGNIVDVCILSDSSILIADDVKQCISQFTNNGEYMRTVLRQGSGPEEYEWVGGISDFGDGCMIYEYYQPLSCIFLNEQFDVVNRIVLEEVYSADNLEMMNDSAIIGRVPYITGNEGRINISMNLCSWDYNTGEKQLIHFSKEFESSNPNTAYSDFVQLECAFAASRENGLYIAPEKYDHTVHRYAYDGYHIDTLYTEHEPITRDSTEIALEQMWRKRRDGMLGDWQPSSQPLGVIQLFIQDSKRMIWVSHGSYYETEFDVYNFLGDLVYTCSVEGLPSDNLYYYEISDDGYLAYTISPKEYPRVFIMELRAEN